MNTQQISSTAECLVDYAEHHPQIAARKFLAAFTENTEATIDDWIRGNRAPKGINLLQLRCFLDAVGYRVKELELIPEDNQKLARLLAFKLVTLEKAAHYLGYTDIKSVYDLVLRGVNVMPARAFQLERLLAEYATQLQEVIGGFVVEQAQLLSGRPSANGLGVASSPKLGGSPLLDAPSEVFDIAHDLVRLARQIKLMLEGPNAEATLRTFHRLISAEEARMLIGELNRLGAE